MCSLKILLINNEPNSEDLGLIPDAEEYGLPSGCLQIQNLKKKLAAYGEVIVTKQNWLGFTILYGNKDTPIIFALL